MVRVTIELLPHGREEDKCHLGTILIANDATSETEHLGHYSVRLSKRTSPTQQWRVGRVEDFPRKKLGAYDLLFRALAATIGRRNSAAMRAPHIGPDDME